MNSAAPTPEESRTLLRVGSLAALDALIGERLTGEKPRTHWEDANTHFQFGTVEEALEALHDPFFKQFVPAEEGKATVLTEVKEFRRYSSDLSTAWDVVDHVTRSLGAPLQVRRDTRSWIASFGPHPGVAAQTAPLAICLAALRAKGIEVELERTALEKLATVRCHRAAMSAAEPSRP